LAKRDSPEHEQQWQQCPDDSNHQNDTHAKTAG
jgi:hypothetical protein